MSDDERAAVEVCRLKVAHRGDEESVRVSVKYLRAILSMAREPPLPLAESTTVVRPDDGNGPWVQSPRMAVPRGAVGSRVSVVVYELGDKPGEE